MFKKASILFLVILISGMLLPLASLAGTYQTSDGFDVNYDGLVPCGKCVNISPASTTNQMDKDQCGVTTANTTNKYTSCQLCHLFVVFDSGIDFLLTYIVFPLGALMIVIGGLMLITAVEDASRIEKAKKLITSTFIGLIIIFASWAVINLFFIVIGLSSFALQFTGPGKWFTINCPISL